MNIPPQRFVLIFTVLLTAFSTAAPGADPQILWQIGQFDNQATDLALGPDGYSRWTDDPVFLVGTSDAKADWPYTLPGPADGWAGATTHTATVLFALKDVTPGTTGRLVIDMVDTHAIRPPVLKIRVNGRQKEIKLSPGGGDASITGNAAAGKETVLNLDLPAGTLAEGLNRIEIANVEKSWLVFDALRLEISEGKARIADEATVLLEATASPWLTPKGDTLTQEVRLTVGHLGKPRTITAAVGDVQKTVRLEPGIRMFVLGLPADIIETTPVQEKAVLLDGDQPIAQMEFTRPVGRLRELVDYVDPMIGTASSRWLLYPGPSMPFGMVKLSPDNQRHCWKAGYEYTIENIAGFSHIHSWTMGGLMTMPTAGPLQIEPGEENDPDAGYRSRFSHDNETASAGYYAVTLDDYNIRAELTSTTRVGFQRYTFPKSDQARILFDLLFPTEYNFSVLDAKITKVSDTEIEGYSQQRGETWATWNDYKVHFVVRFNKPFRSMGGWDNGNILHNITEVAGKDDIGAFVEFQTTEGEQILMQAGISLVSTEQARLNLETEMKPFGWDFDACRRSARDVWQGRLGRIEIEGGTETDRVKFYTNMYRSYCARTIWNDVNGKYVDMYEKVQQLPEGTNIYGCDAFWNTFWNLNQLWTLVNPELAEDWVRSLLEIEKQGGWLAKGPTGIEYSSIMVASHEIALIVAAYQKGLRNFDVEQAYKAIKFIQTTQGRPHPGGGHVGNQQLDSYMKYGFVPVENGPVSNTLEYAYDDWCAAQMAKALGKEDDYQMFLRRAANYRNVFDSSVGHMRQKHADGRWVENFSPYSSAGFVEGNSWQYTWFAPQDVAGLIGLMGKDEFNNRLNDGMTRSAETDFNASGDNFAAYPVNHGNQPNMQAAYLFNYSGKPWLTQRWARAIMNQYYGDDPIDGWLGDEDQGQMGAWFVMSAMGLFQMDGGCSVKPIYEIGSPLFDKITIHLDKRYYPGEKFEIIAENNSPENVYIQSAELNGRPLNQPWFYQEELLGGGRLVLHMGPEPNTAWGSAPDAAPPSGIPAP